MTPGLQIKCAYCATGAQPCQNDPGLNLITQCLQCCVPGVYKCIDMHIDTVRIVMHRWIVPALVITTSSKGHFGLRRSAPSWVILAEYKQQNWFNDQKIILFRTCMSWPSRLWSFTKAYSEISARFMSFKTNSQQEVRFPLFTEFYLNILWQNVGKYIDTGKVWCVQLSEWT